MFDFVAVVSVAVAEDPPAESALVGGVDAAQMLVSSEPTARHDYELKCLWG